MFNRQKKINRKGCTAAPPLAVVARKENGTSKEVERKKNVRIETIWLEIWNESYSLKVWIATVHVFFSFFSKMI